MSLSIAAYRQAGDQIEDGDVADNANIQTAKLGTQTLYRSIPGTAFLGSGSGVSQTNSGVFGGTTLPNANSGSLYASIPLPDEYVSGDITLKIFWNSAGTAGDLKLTADVKSTTDDGTMTSEETDTVTTTVNGTTTRINQSSIVLSGSNFTAGDVIGLLISRDPADAADTLASDVLIIEVTLEFTGRG